MERTDDLFLCPVCKSAGVSVSKVTVSHLVKEEYLGRVSDGKYRICMLDLCDVAYFSNDGAWFAKDQLKVPLWYKKGADPMYACYCSRVTEQQVLDAVVKGGADSVGDVNAATLSMQNPDCIKNNPLGICCHAIIEQAIAKGKSMKNDS